MKISIDEKLSILQKQNRILNDEKETLLSNVQRSNSVNNNLESEKRDLHIQLDKYIRENDRLKGKLIYIIKEKVQKF